MCICLLSLLLFLSNFCGIRFSSNLPRRNLYTWKYWLKCMYTFNKHTRANNILLLLSETSKRHTCCIPKRHFLFPLRELERKRTRREFHILAMCGRLRFGYGLGWLWFWRRIRSMHLRWHLSKLPVPAQLCKCGREICSVADEIRVICNIALSFGNHLLVYWLTFRSLRKVDSEKRGW